MVVDGAQNVRSCTGPVEDPGVGTETSAGCFDLQRQGMEMVDSQINLPDQLISRSPVDDETKAPATTF